MIKKLTFSLFLLFILSIGTTFASESVSTLRNSEDVENDNSEIGVGIGFRISILGLEPEASFIFKNLDISVFTPLSRGLNDKDQYKFGIGLGASVGYIDSPFEKGWQNTIGASFLYLPANYLQIIPLLNDSDVDASLYGFFINYRGTWKIGRIWGLQFRGAIPLVVGSGKDFFTIIDKNGGSAICWLLSLATFGIGARWEFGL